MRNHPPLTPEQENRLNEGIDHLIAVGEKLGQSMRELRKAVRAIHQTIDEPDQHLDPSKRYEQ